MKLSIREKIGFSLGDMAGNFVYQSVVLILAFYYTDIFGLEASTVTGIFLFVRIFDSITDPLMGILVDRTQTRWGKYRPYLLFLCIPYAIMSVLVFTVPDFDVAEKTIYAYITYSLLMLLFTATNIPYFALGNVLTSNPEERVSLNSYRFAAATTGGLIVTSLFVPLAEYLGGEDKAMGYQQAMIVMAALSVVLFIICFSSTKERVVSTNDGKKNFITDFKQVLKNDQWRLLGLAVVLLVFSQIIKGTISLYYLNYYVDDAKTFASLFLSLWMIGGILGSALTKFLTNYMCKKDAWVLLCLVSAVISFGTYFIAPNLIVFIFVVQFFVGFFNQMMAPLIFSTMADVVDYGELINKRRLDGLISSLTIFSLKIGLALGGAGATYFLVFYNYESGGVQQNQETVDGILNLFTIVPAVGFVLTAFVIHKMKLSSKVVNENAKMLEILRNGKGKDQ